MVILNRTPPKHPENLRWFFIMRWDGKLIEKIYKDYNLCMARLETIKAEDPDNKYRAYEVLEVAEL